MGVSPGTRSSRYCALKLFLLDQMVTETSLEVISNDVTDGTRIPPPPNPQFWLGLAVSGLLKPSLTYCGKAIKSQLKGAHSRYLSYFGHVKIAFILKET